MRAKHFLFHQQQNVGRKFVVDLLFYVHLICVGLCFGMHYFVSFLVLQSS